MSESYFQRAIKEWSETTPPGGVSWPIWIANRAEAAESRAAQLEAELRDMTQKRDSWYDDCKGVESERDTAWQELREIRRLIQADDNEATVDEVTRKMYRLSKDAHDAEQERDKAIAEFSVLKQYALEMQAGLVTARADIVRYQDERVTLLGRIETLAAELQAQAQLIEQLKEQLPMVSG